MKIISILLPNLRGGGAERLAIYLANDWVARGFAVEFVLMQEEGELLPLVSPEISIVSLQAKRIKWSILPFYRYLSRTQPDVVWVNMWPLTSAAIIAWLMAGKPGRLYTNDHNQLSVSCVQELKVWPAYLKLLMRATYPSATGVMAVSQGVKEDMCRLGSLPNERVKVIYNPAAIGVCPDRESVEIRERLWGVDFSHHILAVGTLKAQKNYELLIRAFAKLSPNLKAKLIILGEGSLRTQLEILIVELDLQERVSLPGFAADPYPWFRSADLFVLSSSWEGFGNVMVEALECGVPVVSTDCPSGPAEILENGRFGKLVPVGDVEALAVAMAASLHETHDRQALMNRAKDFTVERISDQYLDYFELLNV